MSKRLRLIGGSHAGETFTVDEHIPVLHLAVMENCSFNRAPEDIVQPSETFSTEHYVVQPMKFDSGHEHHYAVCEPMRLVDAMNAMWDAYSPDAISRQKR